MSRDETKAQQGPTAAQPSEGYSHAESSIPRPDIDAAVFIWTVWILTSGGVLICIGRYTVNVPLLDEWETISTLTGTYNTVTYLMDLHNEHFIPLPKLIILGQLQLTGWDFRAGTVFNAALLGVLAAAMIEAARRLRGRMNYTDAFFPLALLNFGNHFNLFIGWQIQFIGSVVLAGVLLLIIVRNRERLTTGTVALAGVCLMLLPLFGANGVVL